MMLRRRLQSSCVRDWRSRLGKTAEAFQIDQIAAQIIAGDWVMPHPGDSVKSPSGHARNWEPGKGRGRRLVLGGSLRSGYIAMSFSAPEASVMMLEASGHGMVYVDGEPRAGDPYSTGYVHLPVRVQRGRMRALVPGWPRPVEGKVDQTQSTAFLSAADVTIPDVAAGEPVQCEAALLVVNASENSRNDLVITARLPAVRKPEPPYLLSSRCRYARLYSSFEARFRRLARQSESS